MAANALDEVRDAVRKKQSANELRGYMYHGISVLSCEAGRKDQPLYLWPVEFMTS